MRFLLSIIISSVVGLLCYVFNSRDILPVPLGKLLSPQHGIWQNAEATDKDYSEDISIAGLNGKVSVYFDDRLVPHLFADDDNDAYFVQGYLHAKFRLWQMELQTMAAAGRASEIIGEKALNHDREFRRLGMVYAAENSLTEMEKNPVIKAECDAYTNGVNAFIATLTESTLPIEYKIIGYYPEKWSNFKSALFLKYMSYDLSSHETDFEMTNARSFFSKDAFNALFPFYPDSLNPVIPKGTVYSKSSINLSPPVNMDSLFTKADSVSVNGQIKPDRDNGSNNWAVSASKTLSGAPILCNDPHLSLNLPSLWYEMQITTPNLNVYGVTFPGAPSVIIGFNDSCAWGVTNGGRDVRDYYKIHFNEDHSRYQFNGEWISTSFRYEKIKVAGSVDVIDTVAYTVFGPVMYDNHFGQNRNQSTASYAVRWKAHDPSNELLTFHLLNRAKNYEDYIAAVIGFQTPGQNFVFATKSGYIALRTQGAFPAKWKEQGDYLMDGKDSTYVWRGIIPQEEVPYQLNPLSGFVSSANQQPADSTYPYYLGRDYPTLRGTMVNRLLTQMNSITIDDMMRMQNNNFNLLAENVMPIFRKNIQFNKLNDEQKKFWNVLDKWNLYNDAAAKGATIFDVFWNCFYNEIYGDELSKAPQPCAKPLPTTLMEAVCHDSAYVFIDNVNTSASEKLSDVVTSAFIIAADSLRTVTLQKKLAWGVYKDTRVTHLAKLDAFSSMHLNVGGGSNIINAIKNNHGPSWRMIVQLSSDTEAYGVYPGGQSGNPGSKFYDNFINNWVNGKYYKLWLMKFAEKKSKRILAKMNFNA